MNEDPTPLTSSLDDVLRSLRRPGLRATVGVFANWDEIVGPHVAAHAQPVSPIDGRLVVEVDQPGWATQLRFLEADLVSRLAPPLVSGNSVVLLASEARPLPAVTLSEVLATSDVPGGVVNVLTGLRKELIPVLAAHEDVDALDTWGVPDALRTETEIIALNDIKRVLRRPTTVSEARFDWSDDRAAERPEWIAAFLEMKTVWHPIGV